MFDVSIRLSAWALFVPCTSLTTSVVVLVAWSLPMSIPSLEMLLNTVSVTVMSIVAERPSARMMKPSQHSTATNAGAGRFPYHGRAHALLP